METTYNLHKNSLTLFFSFIIKIASR